MFKLYQEKDKLDLKSPCKHSILACKDLVKYHKSGSGWGQCFPPSLYSLETDLWKRIEWKDLEIWTTFYFRSGSCDLYLNVFTRRQNIHWCPQQNCHIDRRKVQLWDGRVKVEKYYFFYVLEQEKYSTLFQ